MPPPQFLPTPSARRATTTQFPPLTGVSEFLPTPSARRATGFFCVKRQIVLISTHALREEGDRWYIDLCKRRLISTHALREEGDQLAPQQRRVESQISTHALREEGDGQRQHNGGQGYDFYPRPPRGGRPSAKQSCGPHSNFYPRPPRGGRQRSIDDHVCSL